MLVLAASVSAVGLSPSDQNIEYKPGESVTVGIDVVNINFEPMAVTLFPDGAIKDNVEIDPKNIVVPARSNYHVNVKINFPKEPLTPGWHPVYVGATEGASQLTNTGTGFGTVVTVKAAIYFFIPYPGKYAEISLFEVPDTNLGDDLNIEMKIRNVGLDLIGLIEGNIELSLDNEIAKSISVIVRNLPSQEDFEFRTKVNTTDFQPGDYFARAVLRYDGIAFGAEKPFKIGTFFVKLLNYSNTFEKDKISRFELEIENRWGKEVKGVSAQVFVLDANGEVVTSFKTPSLDLKPWAQDTLWTFFDTTGLNKGEYRILIRLSYENESYEETGKIYIFERLKIDMTKLLIGIIIFIILIDLLWFILGRRKKEDED
ncbi:MAG TPA: hypothetical protein VJB94_01775 [Candidatus Nanoarchaeia archaeon]|nr:hypothetical protein [Candidatus Nanoarchaeia archaeon]